MARYVNIPVSEETAKQIQALCVVYEMGKRGQGALVQKMVRKEFLEASKLPQFKYIFAAMEASTTPTGEPVDMDGQKLPAVDDVA